MRNRIIQLVRTAKVTEKANVSGNILSGRLLQRGWPAQRLLTIGFATMTLGAHCGVAPAPTMALPLSKRHAVAVARFDRANGKRQHALTAYTALRAAGMEDGYPELAQLLRRHLGRHAWAQGEHAPAEHGDDGGLPDEGARDFVNGLLRHAL